MPRRLSQHWENVLTFLIRSERLQMPSAASGSLGADVRRQRGAPWEAEASRRGSLPFGKEDL
jgi:hypothetical protein